LIFVQGDFFKTWFQCKLNVKKIKENPFTAKILKEMDFRQKQLMENDAVRAALYLDPRFTFDGTSILSLADTIAAQVSVISS
jgi:hypothetical protein